MSNLVLDRWAEHGTEDLLDQKHVLIEGQTLLQGDYGAVGWGSFLEVVTGTERGKKAKTPLMDVV